MFVSVDVCVACDDSAYQVEFRVITKVLGKTAGKWCKPSRFPRTLNAW